MTSALARIARSPAARDVRAHTVLAALVVFALQWVHGPAQEFLYDAAQYWAAPLAVLSGGDVSSAGALTMRGVFSAVIYLPPAAVSSVLGPESAPWAVLAWNAALAAALFTLVVPALAAVISPHHRIARLWASALVGGIAVAGFARYPLLDVWSAAFALVGIVVLLTCRRWYTAVIGGLALVVAANLRPSYLAPLLLVAVVLLVTRPRRVLWAPVGVAIGLAVQVVYNLAIWRQFSLVPVHTPFLVQVQSAQAAYAIRYDTVAFSDRHPQQWYCDPSYAKLLLDEAPPSSPTEVLSSALGHLPDSLWLFSEKVSASLRWTTRTPFEPGPGGGLGAVSLIVIGVSAIGLVCLIAAAVAGWKDRARRGGALAVIALWLGSVATLVLSTPETRFALPLLLVGVVGLAAAPLRRFRGRRDLVLLLVAAIGSILLLILLVTAGEAGVAHPAPPGPLADAAACAALVPGAG